MTFRTRSKMGTAVAMTVLGAAFLAPALSPNASASTAVARQDALDQIACAQPAGQKALSNASTAVATYTASLSSAGLAAASATATLTTDQAVLAGVTATHSTLLADATHAAGTANAAKAKVAATQKKLNAALARKNSKAKTAAVKALRAQLASYQRSYTSLAAAAAKSSAIEAQSAAEVTTRTAQVTSDQAAASAANSLVASTTSELSAARASLSTLTVAQTKKPVVFFTQNLDFATGPSKDKPVLDRLCAAGADFVMVQEAKNLTLSSLISPALATNQNTADQAHRGSAVIWRKAATTYPSARVAAPTAKGLALGVDARAYHVKMLNRYISYVDTKVDGVRTRVISAHWAPTRYTQTWGPYTASIRKVIASRPKGSQWIIGADYNQLFSKVGHELHARSYGSGIIGFVVSDGLTVTSHNLIPYAKSTGASDHPAYRITVTAR